MQNENSKVNTCVPLSVEKVFFPLSEWHEDDGDALFFKLDSGEPPEVTSPLVIGFDFTYFTHWMKLPKEFGSVDEYKRACIASGIATKL